MHARTSTSKSFHDPFLSTLCWRYISLRPKVHVHRLNRSWKLSKEAREKAGVGKLKTEILEVKNMKLYMLNKIIVEENEQLRRKAMILLQENKILLSQFQKLPQHPDSNSNKY